MPIDRPQVGGEVALGDDDLARIGLAVVLESGAKAIAISALRALCNLNEDIWIKLDRAQFIEILKRTKSRVMELADLELRSRFVDLEIAVEQHHELRHVIVHVMWGAGGNGFLGYDYKRERLVDAEDITLAVDGCAEIKRAASWFAMRVANLIEDGILPQRSSGKGMALRTIKGLVRL